MDFLLCFQIRCTLYQVLYIAVVHADDPIKMIEILRADRTGTMGQMVTAAGSVHPHTAIGQLPLVIAQDTGRVYFNFSFQTFFLN